MKVGIIGCGLIGNKRARVVKEDQFSTLCCASDSLFSNAESLVKEFAYGKATAYQDWKLMLDKEKLDVVIVATPNKYHKEITLAATQRIIHVLCEKPLGRNLEESVEMVEAARKNNVFLKTGFNHRHHPAIWKAHELCSHGTIGPPMFIRAVYGHGGRPGYEKEWRADPELAGGGELLDQGVHILDLCHWFMGDLTEVFGHISTYYWDLGYFRSVEEGQQSAIHRQLEDNAFVLLRTSDGRIAQFHTSWTQWKNRFMFEIFGEIGYLIIDGLGGSYGVETLRIGKRKLVNSNKLLADKADKTQTLSGELITNQLITNNVVPRYAGGAPDEELIEFPGPDLSWQAEWQEFASAVREKRQPLANGEEGLKAMQLIDAIYTSARENRLIKINER